MCSLAEHFWKKLHHFFVRANCDIHSDFARLSRACQWERKWFTISFVSAMFMSRHYLFSTPLSQCDFGQQQQTYGKTRKDSYKVVVLVCLRVASLHAQETRIETNGHILFVKFTRMTALHMSKVSASIFLPHTPTIEEI